MSLIGRRIGNYEIKAKIGEGGMGTVYLGEHPLIGKRVAIKVLLEELVAKQDVVSRFFNEAKAVNDIGHLNIVDVVDFGKTSRRAATKRSSTSSWSSSTARRCRRASGAPGLPFEDTLHIMAQCCSALAASHAKGIVHRDLKPENIFLVGARRRQELRQDPRLRHRQADRRRRHDVAQDAHRPRHRHADVHEPRAVRGQRAHRPPLATSTRSASSCTSCSPARVPVPGRGLRRGAGRAPDQAAGQAVDGESEPAAGDREHRDARDREGSQPALPEHERVPRGGGEPRGARGALDAGCPLLVGEGGLAAPTMQAMEACARRRCRGARSRSTRRRRRWRAAAADDARGRRRRGDAAADAAAAQEPRAALRRAPAALLALAGVGG